VFVVADSGSSAEVRKLRAEMREMKASMDDIKRLLQGLTGSP
jgi:hypothetical protein